MSKVNGTSFLVYVNGTMIAAQRNCTINFNQDLPDASSKDSAGWAEHINGLRDGSVDFDALYATTGLSHSSLMTKITGRLGVLVVVETDGDPIVMGGSMSNLTVEGPQEETAPISGTFTATGGVFLLSDAQAELITEWSNVDYDTFASTGTRITSAITDGSALAEAESDAFSVTDEDVIKVIFFLDLDAGIAPSLVILDGSGGSEISNTAETVDGLNVITLTVSSTDATSVLDIYNANGVAATFDTGKIYVFKT